MIARVLSPGDTRLDHVGCDATAIINCAVRGWMLAHQNPTARQALEWASAVGSFRFVFWMSVLVAFYLVVVGRRRGVISCLLAPLLALATYTGIKNDLISTPDRPAPRGWPKRQVRFRQPTARRPPRSIARLRTSCGAKRFPRRSRLS